MPIVNTAALTSSMSIFSDRRYIIDTHFKWSSIKKFMYLACTHSTSTYNFDIFSRICWNVKIFHFLLCEMIVGMPYMFMDCFIKQYTRKLNSNKHLNPLLRGITYGLFLQTGLWTLIHATYLADSMRYFVSSLQDEPSWSSCHKTDANSSCVTAREIMLRCREKIITKFVTTSAHFYYMKTFTNFDKTVLTSRLFAVGVVWIFNFFFTTIQDDTLIKFFRLTFVCRTVSTVITIVCIMISTKYSAVTAFTQMMDISAPGSLTNSMHHVAYLYGIGFLGLYDFANMSPYTMIDNAVVIFTVLFTAIAFLRSWIVRVLYIVLTDCVEVEIAVSPHYLLFAILPLSTEFLYAHKFYVFYIYVNMMVSTLSYVSLLTLTMSKILHDEFRSVKNIYVIGLVCFLGFICCVAVTMLLTISNRFKGMVAGIDLSGLYLGGFKMAIVMWVYGVKRFSTDIHFWLGFKPTKYWTICWTLSPILLLIFLINNAYIISQWTELRNMVFAIVWIAFIVSTVTLLHIKTIVRFLLRNNLAAIFNCTPKYGPPDSEDRKQRRHYNETMRHRQCKHNCNVMDEVFDCNHLVTTAYRDSSASTSNSSPSLTNIFEAGNIIKPPSGLLESESHH